MAVTRESTTSPAFLSTKREKREGGREGGREGETDGEMRGRRRIQGG